MDLRGTGTKYLAEQYVRPSMSTLAAELEGCQFAAEVLGKKSN